MLLYNIFSLLGFSFVGGESLVPFSCDIYLTIIFFPVPRIDILINKYIAFDEEMDCLDRR